MSIEKKAGELLRENRLMCGMSAEQLSDAVFDRFGVEISPSAIRRYERAERCLTLADTVMFAVAMDINIQNLVEGLDPRQTSKNHHKKIGKLSAVVHDVLLKIATEWRGNVDALIIACAVYASLPGKYALNAIMGLMEQVALALRDGAIVPEDLPNGMAILEQEIGKLSEAGNQGVMNREKTK